MIFSKKNKNFTITVFVMAAAVVALGVWYFLLSHSLALPFATGQETDNVTDYVTESQKVQDLIKVFQGNYFDNSLFKSLKVFIEPFSVIPGGGNPNLFNPPEVPSPTSTPK